MSLFDAHADRYDQWYQTELGQYADGVEKEMLVRELLPQVEETALDLGCGTGAIGIWLAKFGVEVVGVDASVYMLDQAKRNAANERVKIQWVVGDAHHLPFADGTFDIVVANTVIEFIKAPGQALQEAMRVLKPGGRLAVGIILSSGPWAELYRRHARQNPNSVFNHATFYNEEAFLQWLPDARLSYGLNVAPDDFCSLSQALQLEADRAGEAKRYGSFAVVSWVKPQL